MLSKIASASAAVLLACAAVANATPYAEVYNGLSENIYFELVNAGGVIDSSYIPPGQGHEITLGHQVSMKMDLNGSFKRPYQFEFNYDPSTGQTYYDFSAINGDPFSAYPRSITPTHRKCQAISCAAGDRTNDCQYTRPRNFHAYECTGKGDARPLLNVVIGGAPINN